MNATSRSSKPSAVSTILVAGGQSRRLAEMRQAAAGGSEPPATAMPETGPSSAVNGVEAALFKQAILLIDEKLTFVSANFPLSGRQRFFKIRFGMTREELYALPIRQIFTVLRIPWSRLPGGQRIAGRNYHGRRTS